MTERRPPTSPDTHSNNVVLTYHQTRYTQGDLDISAVTGESVHEHIGNVGTLFCDDDSLTVVFGNVGTALINQWSDFYSKGDVDDITITKNSTGIVDGNVGRAKVENGGKLFCTGSVEVPNSDEHGEIVSEKPLAQEHVDFFEKRPYKK